MTMNYNKQVAAIADYIRKGETGRDNFRLGMELEHFLIHKDTLKTVSYYGEDGIESTLRDLSEYDGGFRQVKENGHLLELHKGPINFTTEPGGQLELSLAPENTIQVIEEEYLEQMKVLREITEKKNQWIINMAYHPVTKIDDIKLLPKERYHFMYEYFKTSGRYAHNMMKGTCSLQVSIDYLDEQDFREKYRLLSAMSPIFYTLFDNGPRFEGADYPKHNLRQGIWEETDRPRTGIIPNAFEENFGYESYAQWLLELPPIFMKKDGGYVPENRPFREIFDPDTMGEEEIFHMLSIVFPDIRAKSYLEIRMMDSLPYPLNIAVVAMIKGIFLSRENVDILHEKFRHLTFRDVQRGKAEAEKYGIKGMYLDDTIQNHGLMLFNMACDALSSEECGYLSPIRDLAEQQNTPRDRFERLEEKEGMSAAVESNAFKL